MKRPHPALFIVLAFALTCCVHCNSSDEGAAHTTPQPESGNNRPEQATQDRVWVTREFTGGQQCQGMPANAPSAEFLLSELRSRNVRIYRHVLEPMAVCSACNCPAYAVKMFVMIAAADLAKARSIGYQLQGEPPSLTGEM
ncbi:MAG: hypothetical protein KDK30_01295 [Leptospiraceae bacterium]|nr:hypothetical protein [Leptospiraceae bacterium]MCB1322996.1 hypothetical protein [Leptospiraceae bacterium]